MEEIKTLRPLPSALCLSPLPALTPAIQARFECPHCKPDFKAALNLEKLFPYLVRPSLCNQKVALYYRALDPYWLKSKIIIQVCTNL